MRRIIWIALVSLVVLCVGYLTLANVLLMTSLGPKLASSERTKIDWRTGWSLVPTRVHLRDATFERHGKSATWRVSVERVEASVSLTSLLSGRFHARSAELAHVSLETTDMDGATSSGPQPPLPAPPPRPGEPPLATTRPVDGGGDDEPTVRIDELSASDVRTVRIGTLAYRGAATVRGSFAVKESGAITLAHATVELPSGELAVDDLPMLSSIRGNVSLVSHAVDPDAPVSRAWLGATEGGLELEADIAPGAVLDRLTNAPRDLRGYVRTSLRIVDGALAPQSTAEVRTEPPVASLVLGVADDGKATLTALVRGLRWPQRGEPIATPDEVRATLYSPRIALADPLHGANGVVDARALELRASRLPGVGRLVRGDGILRGDATFVITDGVISGRSKLTADTLGLSLGDVVVDGKADADIELRAWHLGSGEARLHASLTHTSADARARVAVTFEDAVLRFGGHAPTIDANVTAESSDARIALDALTGSAELPTFVAVVASTQSAEGSATLHADETKTSLSDIDARAGIVTLRGAWVRSANDAASATLLLEAGPLASGVSVEHGTTTFVLFDARGWFEHAISERAAAALGGGT